MAHQSTSHIVMVSPDHFGFNPQTAETNAFMHTPEALHKNEKEVRDGALSEFETVVNKLRENDVEVLVLPSRNDVVTPDAVYPNNWFSHHSDGRLVLYPMLPPNRRLERQKDALLILLKEHSLPVSQVIDLSPDEEQGRILESTGSMIFDRIHKVAFAMESSRTTRVEFEKWCTTMDYEGVFIPMPKSRDKEVYHTNLLLAIGTGFAVACLEIIKEEERRKLKEKLESLGKEVIEISLDQVYGFCGNILEVQSADGKKKIMLSETAKKNFTKEQLAQLTKHGEIVSVSIPTIEEIGGGGVRCMLAEVFA